MGAIITSQPIVNEVLSAYKPVIIACTATTDDGSVPSIVFCDVYVNAVYYRTFFSTKAERSGQYVFEIQDALQEKLKYFIPPVDGHKIEISSSILSSVFVKIRTARLNAEGLNQIEQLAPVPGTNETLPVSGDGVQSHSFFVSNILVQHREVQDIKTLLGAFRTGTWNAEALPLTRRNERNLLTNNQSSFFPFLSSKRPKKICVDVKYKGSSAFTRYCKELTAADFSEINTPPVVDIRWKDNNGTEVRYCSQGNCQNLFSILRFDQDNDIVSQLIEQSTDSGVTWQVLNTYLIDEYTATADSNSNYSYRASVTDAAGNKGTSNILQVKKELIPVPVFDFYYKAVHPASHPDNATVTYKNEYGVQQTVTLQRLASAADNPCTLIVASAIVSTLGAMTCTMEENSCKAYKIPVLPHSTTNYSFTDCQGVFREYSDVNDTDYYDEISVCALLGTLDTGGAGYVEVGDCGSGTTLYRAHMYGNSGDDLNVQYFDKNGNAKEEVQYAPSGAGVSYLEIYVCAITGTVTTNGTLEAMGAC